MSLKTMTVEELRDILEMKVEIEKLREDLNNMQKERNTSLLNHRASLEENLVVEARNLTLVERVKELETKIAETKTPEYQPNQKMSEIEISNKYDWIGEPQLNGLRVVSKDYKLGFIDSDNNEIVAPSYEFLEDFQENGLATYSLDNLVGLVNEEGDIIFEPVCSYIQEFRDGFAFSNIEGKDCKINTEGYTTWDDDPTEEAKVEEEAAIVTDTNQLEVLGNLDGDLPLFTLNGKQGAMNKNEEVILGANYDKVSTIVESDGKVFIKADDRSGLVNKEKTEIDWIDSEQ